MNLRRIPPTGRGARPRRKSKSNDGSMNALLRRCTALLTDLPVSLPFDVDTLAGQIAARRGRPVILTPMQRLPGLTGLWIASASRDIILYSPRTTRLHRDHIILHELCHLWCGHDPIAATEADLASILGPDISANTVRQVLRRAGYSTVEEREAEVLASLILQHASGAHESDADGEGGTDTDLLHRLAAIVTSNREGKP